MRHLTLLVLTLCALPAFAQNLLSFTAATTTGDGVVTPSFTWNTTPLADSCMASGQWSGEKGGSGMETLPPIDRDATFNLLCTWPGDAIATFTWTPAMQNANGTEYTDPLLVRFKMRFDGGELLEGTPCGGPVRCSEVADSTGQRSSMHTVTGITDVGTMRAAAFSVNQRNVSSGPSNVVTKAFTGLVTVQESVGITVNPVPAEITDLAGE